MKEFLGKTVKRDARQFSRKGLLDSNPEIYELLEIFAGIQMKFKVNRHEKTRAKPGF
ncbi:hypothetical protein [Paucibacter sp. B51]|uniref:hypothetical protein n=1 Tax=Paucibacter sp. B51 TaxID=2993315 RepID=UPI0022EBC4C6|nr:hypothetical protein [Paucibacter sp. B51]